MWKYPQIGKHLEPNIHTLVASLKFWVWISVRWSWVFHAARFQVSYLWEVWVTVMSNRLLSQWKALDRQSLQSGSPNQGIAMRSWQLLETWLCFPHTSVVRVPTVFSSWPWRLSLEALKCLSPTTNHSLVTLPTPTYPPPGTPIAFVVPTTTFSFTGCTSDNKLVLPPQLDFKQLKGKGYVHIFVSLIVHSTMLNTCKGLIILIDGLNIPIDGLNYQSPNFRVS